MIPGSLLDALEDRRLERRDLRVLGRALRELSYYEPRPFKNNAVARGLKLHRSDVSRARAKLLALGYLERGPDDGPRRTYILRAVRGVLAPAPLKQAS